MANILLEIGLEEVPARFIENCLTNLQQNIQAELEKQQLILPETKVVAYGTYRRFAIIIENAKDVQSDIDKILYGPPIRIAKDNEGNWTKAADGFAKKSNVTTSELDVIDNENGESIIAVKYFQKGKTIQDLCPQIFEHSIKKMRLPIAMFWGENKGPFIRPIQWICCIINSQVIDWEIFGVRSSNKTHGHRFLSDGNSDNFLGIEFEIEHPDQYIDKLREKKVIVSQSERKNSIVNQMETILGDHEVDQNLLKEVIHLTEFPQAIEVSFSDQYSKLRKEVLVECLKKHQKAFVIDSYDDEFNSKCIIVCDSVTNHNLNNVKEGNQKVLEARLNDVQFFLQEDIKLNGFYEWNQKLETVIFQEGLGSMAEKVERISEISNSIADQLSLDKESRDIVDRVSKRCKADLMSLLVGELPALQGIVGGYYATSFKEMPEVAIGIRDHYKPRFDGDDFPETLSSIVVAIADRIDTIVACFENNAIPTSSRDPWGIRKAMIAILKILIDKKIPLNINVLIENTTLTLSKRIGENTSKCIEFFESRANTLFIDMKISPDIVQLLKKKILEDPYNTYKKACLLMKLKNDQPNENQLLIETTARVSKIVHKNEHQITINADHFEKDIETIAYDSFLKLKDNSETCNLTEQKIKDLITFCNIMTTYFDNVLVNTDNEILAKNRGSFINMIRNYFFTVGDWQKLQK